MKILPMLVFAAAAGVGSGAMSFKQVMQLNYENAKLTLQVHNLERKFIGLHKRWLAQEGLTDSNLPADKDYESAYWGDQKPYRRVGALRREVQR